MTRRALAAEFIGSAGLLAVVVGSGIMGERLAQGNAAIALLANSIATAAGLYVLIASFAPISGAHFNPVVTLTAAMAGELPMRRVPAYVLAQCIGAIAGTWLAHAMFSVAILQTSAKVRSGAGQMLGELVATFGLVACIRLWPNRAPASIAGAVAAYIGAAYWFTSSTSFANPAVTLARSLSDTFAGIAPQSVPGFVAAQLAGGLAGYFFAHGLWRKTQ